MASSGQNYEAEFSIVCDFYEDLDKEESESQLSALSRCIGARRETIRHLRVAVHQKNGRPRSCPHLIDHIFGARITLTLLFARLFYKVEP